MVTVVGAVDEAGFAMVPVVLHDDIQAQPEEERREDKAMRVKIERSLGMALILLAPS